MVGICIICIAIALGGIGFGIWRQLTCIKLDRHTATENQKLQELNQSLHQTRQSLEEQNQLLFNSNKEVSQKYEENCERVKNSYEELNELNQQQQKLLHEKLKQQIELATLEAQRDTLKRSIDELTSSQKASARASFEQYCEALEYEYQQRETEYDNLIELLTDTYNSQMDKLHIMFKNEESMCKEDIAIIKQELDKIRATRAAAMEAELREQEIKNQATFYTLQINEADKRDISYLQSIEYNLREARPLRMLIWSTFYRDKVNELAARVGAIGASGIYKITHIDSGISYIGQAKDIKERWVKEVKEALGIDAPATNKRCNFMREKGVNNFTFEVLEKCSIAELNEKEKFYIDLYQTYDYGLNGNKGVGK